MMTSRPTQSVVLLVASLVSACERGGTSGTVSSDAQRLDMPVVSESIRAEDFSVVDHQHRSSEQPKIVAVIKRKLSRVELHALARQLAGKAARPTVELMASEAAWLACGRARFDTLRGGAKPKDNEACAKGTLFWMDSTEPRLFHWGLAAPAADARH